MKHSLILISSLALLFNYAYGAPVPSSHSSGYTGHYHGGGSTSTSGSTATGGAGGSGGAGGAGGTGGSSSSTATGGSSTSSTGASTSNSALGSNSNTSGSASVGNGSNNPNITYSNSLTTESCKVAMINAGKPFLIGLCDDPVAAQKASAEYKPSEWATTSNDEERTQGMVWSGHIIGEDK